MTKKVVADGYEGTSEEHEAKALALLRASARSATPRVTSDPVSRLVRGYLIDGRSPHGWIPHAVLETPCNRRRAWNSEERRWR